VKETFYFNNAKYYFVLFTNFIIIVFLIYIWVNGYQLSVERIANKETDNGLWLIIPFALFVIEFIVILLKWILRKILKKEVFTITERGIENKYAFFNVMVFYSMPTAKLIPWDCIKEFKITHAGFGRGYIVAEIDTDKIPSNMPILMKMSVKYQRSLRGFYFGSRSVNITTDKLFGILSRYHSIYSNRVQIINSPIPEKKIIE